MAVLIGTKPPEEKKGETLLVVIRLVTTANGCIVCTPTDNTDMFDLEAYPENTLYYRQCHHRIGAQSSVGEDLIGDDIYTLVSIHSGGKPIESVFVKTRWPVDVPTHLERSTETSNIVVCPNSNRMFQKNGNKAHFFRVRDLSLGNPYDVFEPAKEGEGTE